MNQLRNLPIVENNVIAGLRNEPKTPMSWELVTPEKAKEYLLKSGGNRPSRKNLIERYTTDMKTGNWRRNPQPICFDLDGKLIDGHHRLTAVVESNKPQWFVKVCDVLRDVRLFLDSGASRSDSDALIMDGQRDATANRIATVKRIITGLTVNRQMVTKEKVNDKFAEWKKHILFAEEGMPKKYSAASMLAAISKARIDGIDDERLTRFKIPFTFELDVIHEADADLQPPWKLRLLLDNGSIQRTGSNGQREYYAVALAAIQCFLAGGEMKKKRQATSDDFAEFVKM